MEAERDRDGSVLRVIGEIDLTTAKAFRFALLHAIEAGRTVRVDMTRVGFIDSTGLSGLVAALKEAQRVNGSVRVIEASEAVRTAMTVAGLATRFLGEEPGTTD